MSDIGFVASNYAELVNEELRALVSRYTVVSPIKAALEYTLFPGGKRIRPVFSLLLCRDLGSDTAGLVAAVSSLELLHSSSLIHDDLPALDNDDMRRGRPSCHKAFGEATALLTGDLLVALAFELLTHVSFNPTQKVHAIEVLARAYRDLCNGQQLDLLPAEGRGELPVLHRLKTGSLFGAAAAFAGIAANLASDALAGAEELGVLIGLYFQIVDDFIDVSGAEGAKGRAAGSDLKNAKETCFSSGDLSAAKALIGDTQQRIERCLDDLKTHARSPQADFPGTRLILQKVGSPLKSLL